MNKYINAEKLKKLIDEKWKELADKNVKVGGGKWDAEISTYLSVLRLIDSLQQEQPEVDLEKEIEDYAYSLPHSSTGSSAYVSDKRLPIARQFGIKHDWSFDYVEDIARHFYELGLKARKEDGSHE